VIEVGEVFVPTACLLIELQIAAGVQALQKLFEVFG